MARHDREIATKLSRRRLLTSVCLTVTSLATGCHPAVQRLEVTQSGAPKFERFRADYQFEQPDRLLDRSFAANQNSANNSKVRPVAADTSWSEAQLQIECPHPGGDATLALLTLSLNQRRGVAAVVRREIRQLAVSRSQIELLISNLAREGYFDVASEEAGDARLAVQIDHGKISRGWENDARLLDLAHQTLLNGTDKVR